MCINLADFNNVEGESGAQSQGQACYRDFVKAGIGGAPVRDDLKSQSILGGEKFLETLEPALREKKFIKEIPSSKHWCPLLH
jgi:hypothetical protein